LKINGKLINSNYLNSLNSNTVDKKNNDNKDSFKDLLSLKINNSQDLKISKHAKTRMDDRKISMTDELKDKISNAVNKAQDKGVKDSLVLVDKMAFIVNVKSRTIITAVNENDLTDNVFTNIDGAVIG